MEPMRKPPTNARRILLRDAYGRKYRLPQSVAKKYQESVDAIPAKKFFARYEKKYTKPGMLLRGIRIREGLTQEAFAKLIHVSQANLSKMELGRRPIGKEMAKRIARVFDVNYRSLL